MPGEESEIEIRPLFEAADFGEEFTPELRAQEERLRTEIERKRGFVTSSSVALGLMVRRRVSAVSNQGPHPPLSRRAHSALLRMRAERGHYRPLSAISGADRCDDDGVA